MPSTKRSWPVALLESKALLPMNVKASTVAVSGLASRPVRSNLSNSALLKPLITSRKAPTPMSDNAPNA
ncbi:hypothetical protein D9M70_623400 [compost metagenome]